MTRPEASSSPPANGITMNDHIQTNDTVDHHADTEPAEESGATDDTVEIEVTPTPESLGLALPLDPDEAIGLLMRELAEARNEAGDLLENVQRIAAEFDNYRKRVDRDQVENITRAGQRIIEALLPALDSLDAALAVEATSEAGERMLEGMRATQAQILDTLAREGCTPIASVGEPFDPAVHEAVSVLPGDGDQVVDQELRRGYTMQGRVIRPTLVIVGHA
ncbi:MAG: nucleotide exchange factor GrpE [Acidimicrobiia bacterium]|nr:nucleotide exchange factor GrpE [Acidimicrobiia bacterium]